MPENTTDKVVATANIPNTDLSVNINTDNTVSVISKTNIPNSNKVVFSKNIIDSISTIYDTANNKVVIAYRDYSNSNYGIAIVGTVKNNSIIFGNPVIFNSGTTYDMSITYDSTNNKVIIAYQNVGNSHYGTAIVGTVEDNFIIFGSPVIFNNEYTSHISTTYDAANNKVVIVYRDYGNSDYGAAIVGTVKNNSIIFGTPVVFNSGITEWISATYDTTNNKVIIAYNNYSNSGYGTAIVGTVENNSITFGDPTVFNDNYTIFISATYNSTNNKIVIAYIDTDNSDCGAAIVGSIDNNSITFGNPVVFNNNSVDSISITYDSTNSKVIIAYSDIETLHHGTIIAGTVNNNSITFESPVIFNSSATYWMSIIYNSTNNGLIIAYSDEDKLNCGIAMVYPLDKS